MFNPAPHYPPAVGSCAPQQQQQHQHQQDQMQQQGKMQLQGQMQSQGQMQRQMPPQGQMQPQGKMPPQGQMQPQGQIQQHGQYPAQYPPYGQNYSPGPPLSTASPYGQQQQPAPSAGHSVLWQHPAPPGSYGGQQQSPSYGYPEKPFLSPPYGKPYTQAGAPSPPTVSPSYGQQSPTASAAPGHQAFQPQPPGSDNFASSSPKPPTHPYVQQQQQYQRPQQNHYQQQQQQQPKMGYLMGGAGNELANSKRRVKSAAKLMRQAMDINDIITTLDHASTLLRELSSSAAPTSSFLHATPQLTSKQYYDLYTTILDHLNQLSVFLDTSSSLPGAQYVARDIYLLVQRTPAALARCYLTLTAGAVYLRHLRNHPDDIVPQNSTPHPGCLPTTAASLLTELNDLCNAVQCPTRGLFLRNYMLHVLRDVLPDVSPLQEGGPDQLSSSGDVTQAVEFILANFDRMVTLWGRMHAQAQNNATAAQKQEPAQAKKKRDRERNELRLLVGSNLVRLSQLEHLTEDMYKEVVLPNMLDKAANGCRDTTGQSYIMDCVIQVFPDEFHISTLQTVLATLPKLKAKVNTRSILQALMKRLANYAANLPSDKSVFPEGVDAFQLFTECIAGLRKKKVQTLEFLRLQVALLAFVAKIYAGDLDKVNEVLGHAASYLSSSAKSIPLDIDAIIEIEDLLRVPLSSVGVRVLDLPAFGELMACLPWSNRREVALALVRSVVNNSSNNTRLDDVVLLDRLLTVIAPLLQDDPNASLNETANEELEVFEEEQALVGRIVHLLYSDDTDVLAKMFTVARRHFGHGGLDARLKYTLVPVVYGAVRLLHRVCEVEYPALVLVPEVKDDDKEEQKTAELEGEIEEDTNAMKETSQENVGGEEIKSAVKENIDEGKEEETTAESVVAPQPPPPFNKVTNCRKLFVFLQQTIAAMSTFYPELSIKLYLQCSLAADRCFLQSLPVKKASSDDIAISTCDFSSIAYEFISQAFGLYEEELADSKAQGRCIEALVGTLSATRCFQEEDYEALITKTTQFAAKMLKKTDQSRLVLKCSHLFFVIENHEQQPGENIYKNPKRVLECLQRALKIASSSLTSTAHLFPFVEILDHYLFFFKSNNPIITDKFLTGLIALIKDHRDTMSSETSNEEVEMYFGEIIAHIKGMKASSNTKEAGRFAPVVI